MCPAPLVEWLIIIKSGEKQAMREKKQRAMPLFRGKVVTLRRFSINIKSNFINLFTFFNSFYVKL
jgi:hypothetical protein